MQYLISCHCILNLNLNFSLNFARRVHENSIELECWAAGWWLVFEFGVGFGFHLCRKSRSPLKSFDYVGNAQI